MSRIKAWMSNPGNFGPEEIIGAWPTNPSKYLEWSTSPQDISIWCDTDGSADPLASLHKSVLSSNSKYKIMVLIEPMHMLPRNYEWVLRNQDLFDLIFSTYPDYGNGNPKFKYYRGGLRSYVAKQDFKIYEKSKNMCSVMSSKRYMPGHILRHEIRDALQRLNNSYIEYINPPLTRKVDGLKDYRYELVIENEDSPFFSEKLIDSMVCGCIPVYWSNGDSSYLDIFDKDGIILFSDKDDLLKKINENVFTENFYIDRLDAVRKNFEVAQTYISLGDVLWNCGIKDLIGIE